MDNNHKGPNDPNSKKPLLQNPLLLIAIFGIIIFVAMRVMNSDEGFGDRFLSTSTKNISYHEMKELIEKKEVDSVSIGQTLIKAISKEGNNKTIYVAKRVPDLSLVPLLDSQKINYSGFSESNFFADILGWLLPVLVILGLWMFMASRMQKNMGGGIFGMGSSKKLINAEKPKVRFNDMAGNEEAKEEVVEIVDFLKYPDRYASLGAKIPKGVLLVGPPGTGKTLLAKAVAGEASVPFFSMGGSSFIEMFVGLGASRVRDLFDIAKKEAPSIIFIDEIDAIGKSRAAGGMISGNDEREQTLNQLLAEMDGFGSENAPVIVLAATNRPEILDPALLRPGRFDRQVLVDKPDFKGRVEILKVHIKPVKLANDVDLQEIAKLTAGLAGADLANIINEAALLAGRNNQKEVKQQHLKEAVERGIAGLEKKSRRISPKEKKIVAYHESGHAVISEMTKGSARVNKVSIIPRGMAALGYTLNTPEENKYLMQKHELIAEIDVLLGGRAAEDVFLQEISTGASNDLERATDIIKGMVSYYGMSDVSGLMVLEKQRNSFLGGGFGSGREFSEKMAEEMDSFIKNLLEERYVHVKQTLSDYKDAIEVMVNELFEKEVITGERVREIISEYEVSHNLQTRLVPLEEHAS
ncbi:ATP-dependent zinc metalloprotease FtsH [Helicobacter felis]|uniref:ATP-dependent zinc metalloprotease FtsH n=1 Tax=Helicobacter felis (strain ATCC 49179 / CCUG 28539 / NCTC 12436 / CS1) TaxID=936155 RepID=FTSH_HELFC|nr:ATP-dependent zinc metalloprotease FtsH [Helicobacter felis]O32617.1 RecName: Full=ATP-dependent zinc metalloprotease FtsH [Helicobacter felis ATCC 49179]CAA05102.1 cell cycle protein [Helicobacter felis ATCC 49179]CBY83341.1 membrane bound zinc metallopeptidase [Helicobacter felis ATCC 49179]